GRATAPSEQVVEALARALRLSSAEREHLFVLSGLQPPGPDRVPTHLTPSVQRLVDRLHGTPVAVFDATWTLLTANPCYTALMGDPSAWRGHERNAVWRSFHGLSERVGPTRDPGHARRTRLWPDRPPPPAGNPPVPGLSGWAADFRRG